MSCSSRQGYDARQLHPKCVYLQGPGLPLTLTCKYAKKKKKHFKDYTQSLDHLEPENIPVHESQL